LYENPVVENLVRRSLQTASNVLPIGKVGWPHVTGHVHDESLHVLYNVGMLRGHISTLKGILRQIIQVVEVVLKGQYNKL
jgi:hypothetical protein